MPSIPEQATVSRLEHRVSFFETDAMKVVHHSNYVRYFELGRVVWLDEHDEPYVRYLERDVHYATTKAHAEFHRSARFDDVLEVNTWLEWVRGASLRMAYLINLEDTLIASGWTEHAAVSGEGKIRRIPKANRERLSKLMIGDFDPIS